MSNKISFVMALLAMVGCACAGHVNEPELGGEEGRDELATGEAGNEAVAVDAADGASAEPEMIHAMPVEQLGGPAARITACQEFWVAVDPGASHAAPIVNGTGCVGGEGGLLQMPLPANVQAALKVIGAGFSRFRVQVKTGATSLDMKPLRFISDEVVSAVYQRAGMSDDAPHTAVVETPADGAKVTLLAGGSSQAAVPVYLDAEGNLTDRDSSVAGGWAVFANLSEGIHEVSMSHPALRCVPDAGASWPGVQQDSIALISARGPALAFEPLAIAHSNAFGCR